ncbi:uncharacterized protein LOC126839578 isoform X2 [Adelges cooleyi]|nr:uncharacterized protein LOC126839578 isoform X2 [Adelges cooleyi]XP_050430910.1 uncharacterized protein LOC126839578 isoform X2 [Adelges cooleyi]XP_050430911.1 uncharacterized protein LOC126839578 isoform X2 [Adelges cooleyi]XP_050430912.1 uncharacterized protein LOC126839578 isoform X2 [Adelges cooleyi]
MMFKYMCLILFVAWYQLADCHPAGTDVQSMDTMIEQESNAFLSAEADDSSHKTVRDKRTIGFLRQLFPGLSQIVDRKIQQITRLLFRVIGRLVLRGGGGGGAGAAGGGATGTGGDSSGGNSGGRRISITLPTYPPSTDDEEEEATETDNAGGSTTVLPQQPSPSSSTVGAEAAVSSASAATVIATTTAASEVATSTFSPPITTQQSTPLDTDNQLSTDSAAVKKRTAREVSSTEEATKKQRSASLSDTDVSSDDGSALDDKETEEDPRNKRFLFNLKGGGGGGSGNFLFDLIRRGADRAARAAGGFYRVVAGTDPNTLTLKQPIQYPLLVAGSGATQDRDESSNAALVEDGQDLHTDSTTKEDGYSVGVPGPLTRIFVIANRGVANLIQDLILRLAQTTERIVNFKARLITSLI